MLWDLKAQVAQNNEWLDSFWKQECSFKFWYLKSTQRSDKRGIRFAIVGVNNPKTIGFSGWAERLGYRQELHHIQSHSQWTQGNLGKDD